MDLVAESSLYITELLQTSHVVSRAELNDRPEICKSLLRADYRSLPEENLVDA